MKTRFVIFVIVGVIIAACAGVMTTVTSLKIVGLSPDNPDPDLINAYINIILKGTIIWAIFGIVNGALQFVFSIGSISPTIEDRGMPIRDHSLENFDIRHVGSKLFYIAIVFAIIAATLITPFLSIENLTEPRSLLVRLLICSVASFSCTLPIIPISTFILIRIARRRL